MKKQLLVLLLASLGTVLQAQESSREPWLVKDLANASIERVKAETTGGNITVTGADGGARIEVYVWPANNRDRNLSKEDIKKRLEEDYELTVSADNHMLTATARPKHNFRNGNHGLSISFKIMVPHQSSTELVTSGGNISLSALSGTQNFTTSGGNLNVDHLGGHIRGRTSGGNINLSELKDDIDLSTSGGNIHAGNSQGSIKLVTSGGSLTLRTLQGSIHATTSGGSVTADNIEGDLSAHTSGGNINMSGLACSLETSTSGGNIDVDIKTLGKYVKISNSGGHTDLQLPKGRGIDLKLSADKVSAGALSGFKGDVKENRIEGTIDGGGVPVTVQGGSRINFSMK